MKTILISLLLLSFHSIGSDELFTELGDYGISRLSNNTQARVLLKTNKSKKILEINDSIEKLFKKKSFYLGELENFPIKLIRTSKRIDHLGRIFWEGRVSRDKNSYAVLLYNKIKKTLSAQITYGNKSFTISALGRSVVSAREIGKTPAEGKFHRDFHDKFHAQAKLSRKLQAQAEGRTYSGATVSDPHVDVMILYTAAVAAAIADPAGEAAIRVASANQMLKESCVNFRFRLVHTAQVVYTDDASTTLTQSLDDLRTGAVAGSAALRATHGADLVQIWIENNNSNFGGLGYTTSGNFSSTLGFSSLWRGSSNDITLAHEFGHNLDLTHDRFEKNIDMDQESSQLEGHGFVDVANKLESVMSYPNQCNSESISCDDARKFSNPNILHNGVPFGVHEFANSASKLNDTFPYVAAYATNVSAVAIPAVDNSSCLSSSDNEDLHCFIATAAFDSNLHPYLDTFRSFRDGFLKSTYLGRVFIDFYYEHSPQLAKVIRENEALRIISRVILTPMAWLLEYGYFFGIGILLLIAFKFRKISFLTILIFLPLDNSSAQYAAGTLFDDDVLENPAGTAWRPGGFFSLSYDMDSSKENYDHGPAAEKKQTGLGFGFASKGATFSVELFYKGLEAKRDRSDSPSYSSTEKIALIHGNVGYKLTGETALGVKLVSEQRDSGGIPAISKTIMGAGVSKHFGGGLFVGAGGDIVQIKGDFVPDTKWLDIYLSALIVKPGAFRLEGSLIRSPEVQQSKSELSFSKGSALDMILVAESFLGGGGVIFSYFLGGLSYRTAKEEAPNSVSTGDKEITDLGFKLGAALSGSGHQITMKLNMVETTLGGVTQKDQRLALGYIIKLGAGGGASPQ